MVGGSQQSGHANGAEVGPYLLRTDFPLERDDVVRLAAERGAEPRVVETLERIADGGYGSPGEVLEAVRELDGGPERSLLADDPG